jgi:hypothetical protein
MAVYRPTLSNILNRLEDLNLIKLTPIRERPKHATIRKVPALVMLDTVASTLPREIRMSLQSASIMLAPFLSLSKSSILSTNTSQAFTASKTAGKPPKM